MTLVLDNAMLYNRPDTQYFKVAQKIRAQAEKSFAELDQLKAPHPEIPTPETAHDEGVEVIPTQSLLGDLEPPLETLRLLLSQSAIADQISTELDTDPLSSLFSYELPRLKPSPPPPVLPPPKPKRDRKAERERARQSRLVLDATAGFRARTRSSVAADSIFNQLSDAMDVDAVEPAEPEEPQDDVVDKKKGKRSKRPPIVLPGQTEVPPVVDEVDNQKMFSMFDGGWILPDGQRRNRRVPVERQPLEPKRKKAKTGMCSDS